MIASVRGVVVLAVISALLAILVVVVGPAQPTVVDRSIWSGAEPTELTITHAGERPVVLIKKDKVWRWRDQDTRADAATVDGILTALRARWHRSGAVSAAKRDSLRIGTTTFEIGEPLAGTEQSWIFRDGHALLVDNWVARALVPSRIDLRGRHPFANLASAHRIYLEQFAIMEGTRRTAPNAMWLDPAIVQQFYDMGEALEIATIEPGMPGDPELVMLVDGREFARDGHCVGDRVLLSTPDGPACIDRPAWFAFETAARKLGEPLADPRPLPVLPTSISFADGTVLDLKAADVDRDRVRELVIALQTPGEVVPRTGTPSGKLVAGDITLELFSDGVARAGESVMIRTPQLDILRRPPSAYRDTTRWREDAMTIQSITVDGKTFTRGAVIGEWTGATAPGLVEELAGMLATVRAPSLDKASRETASRHIRVTFTPPTGAPTTHTIDIGERCAGLIDGAPALVSADLCKALFAVH